MTPIPITIYKYLNQVLILEDIWVKRTDILHSKVFKDISQGLNVGTNRYK